MKTHFSFFAIAAILLFHSFLISAQDIGFPFGASYGNLGFIPLPRDSSADAIVLQEFGQGRFDNLGNYNLLFEYHVKIKILKPEGLKYGNIEIPLHKLESREELLKNVKASSFNMENGSMKETSLEWKNIFTEKYNKDFSLKKFAIPNVRVGSIIEYSYTVETPFIYNFRTWEFQSELPKVSSEFWAMIPANYTYNISLAGYLGLSKNESSLVRDCFILGAGKADCSLHKYAMKNIPAFKEEEYMTAKSDHLSAIHFELSEVKYFDGRVDKVTKEWRDVDEELRKHPDFGGQLKKGKDISEQLKPRLEGVFDPLSKAKIVHNFIKEWYRWNGTYSKYAENGIKKAFENKVGNVGDINLSLIAALKYAGLDVEPVILSTRDNGLPLEIYPVMSDFNYVVAKVNIGDKYYLADATDDFIPFGVLPIRCINGKGRVLAEKESSWLPLNPTERAKKGTVIQLTLGDDGIAKGRIEFMYRGYEAMNVRKKVSSFASLEEYFKNLDDENELITITKSALYNLDSLEMSLIQKMDVEVDVSSGNDSGNFLFNPFVMSQSWKENPFKSDERLYPVDFGAPIEHSVSLVLAYPRHLEVAQMPDPIALALPSSGGRFLYEIQNLDNKLVVNTSISVNRTVYTANEYHYLKELFARMVLAFQQDVLFKKKP